MKINIYLATTWNGPKIRPGAGMFLIEYLRGSEPITRQGFIHMREGTEAQGTIRALINALTILNRPCEIVINTQCAHVYNSITNGRAKEWQQSGWINAKGKEVKHKELWQLLQKKLEPHTYIIQTGHTSYTNIMAAAVEKEAERWINKELGD